VLRNFRRTVQIVLLAVFVALAIGAAQALQHGIPPDLFCKIAPLSAVVNSVAGRMLTANFLFAAAVLVLTICVGRAFCGWICPLGTSLDILDWAIFKRLRRKPAALGRVRNIKYFLLAFLLGSAALGVNLSWPFDPLALLSRGINAGFLAPPRLPVILCSAGFLAAICLLLLIAPRFWCRALCPLGALLALPARFSIFRRRRNDQCNECGRCEPACPMGVAPSFEQSGECIQCLTCEAVCPRHAVSLSLTRSRPTTRTTELSRRWVLASFAGGLLLGLGIRPSARPPERRPIRPPGALDEDDFAATCIRCGQCINVCPTGGLKPVVFEAGFNGLLTPALVSRIGPCEYECTACGSACPTGAIRSLSLEQKRATQIGLAVIDFDRCLPWAKGVQCLVCHDVCPYQAVEMRYSGDILSPHVRKCCCTGCGICEFKCPVEGESAIVIVPVDVKTLGQSQGGRRARHGRGRGRSGRGTSP